MMHKSLFFGAALAVALTAGGFAAPVSAKDKPAPAESLSEKIRPSLSAAQVALTKKDYPTALVELDKSEPLASTPYEKFLVGQFRATAGQATKDDKQMLQGLNEAIDSGYSAPQIPTFELIAGQLAYNAGDYPRAIDRLTKAKNGGSKEPALTLLLADSYIKSNHVAQGLAIVDEAYLADQAAKITPEQDMLARAAQAALTAKMPKETDLWLMRLVSYYPTPTNWHDLLVIYRDEHQLSPQGILDLYRLMVVTKCIKSPAELDEYAQTALDKRGLPGEAKAAIEYGMTSGILTHLSPSMTELKNVATVKSVSDRASLASAEKGPAVAATARIAKGNADALFSYKNYAKAIEYYKLALVKGGGDANAINMGLGESYALSGDAPSARAAFSQVTTGETAGLATYWSLSLDHPVK